MNNSIAHTVPALPQSYKLKIKNSSQKKFVFLGLGVISAGALAYLAYNQFAGKPNQVQIDPKLLEVPVVASGHPEGSFPVRKGDRSKKVYRIQNAIISKGGPGAAHISSAGGADGIYGAGTEKALLAEGYPTVVDEATYNKILQDASGTNSSLPATTPLQPQVVASQIFNAAMKRDLIGVIAGLKKLNSVADYTSVNTAYKDVTNKATFVSSTLVTHLLDKTFTSSSDKQAIRNEFLRMGLKYDGQRWSLSGLGNALPGVKTVAKGVAVRDHSGKIHTVKDRDTILGVEFSRKENISYILTANNVLISAPSNLLTYL